MAFSLGDDQAVDLVVYGVDDAGNQVAAAFDAPPTWTSSDDTILTVAPAAADPSGATATATATGKLGSATLHVTGTGASGGATLDLDFVIDVVTTAEVGFAVVPGQPRHKAAPPPPTNP